MKISFCMPVFNKEPFLAQAIESILNQSHKDFELIIIDDKSTDGSRDVCEYYRKSSKKIKLLLNTKNVGVATSRNEAWKHATGDIICPQDADDMSAICRAKATAKFFRTNPKIDIMYGSCGVIDQDGNFIERRDTRDFSIHSIKKNNYIQHITTAYRRNIPVKYREGIRFIDDWYFYMDSIVKGLKFGYVKDLLGLVRAVPDGLTFNNGFATPSKVKKKNALLKEFSNLEQDLTESMKKSLQVYRLKQIVNKVPKGARVLDVGCNTGYVLDMLKRKCKSLGGIEPAQNLRKICEKKGHKIYDKDGVLNFKFDSIIIAEVLEHYDIKTAGKMVAKYFDLLAKGGKLIITVPHKLGPYREELLEEHVRDVSEKDFIKYKNVKFEPMFYGDYAIPVWNLIEVYK